MAVGTTGERRCLSPKNKRACVCCVVYRSNAINESEVPSKVCLLIIFSCLGDAERVLVRAFAGDEARPFGPVLGEMSDDVQELANAVATELAVDYCSINTNKTSKAVKGFFLNQLYRS